jgi:hypothetical protein
MHAKKNENKGLARLKESIAKAKAEKRAAAAAAAVGSGLRATSGTRAEHKSAAAAEGGDTDDGSSEDSSDESSDESRDDDEDETAHEGARRAAPKIAGGLLRPRRLPTEPNEGDLGVAIMEDEEAAALAGLQGVQQARVRRIIRDTQELAASSESGGPRGPDGLTPFQRLAHAKALEAAAASGDRAAKGTVEATTLKSGSGDMRVAADAFAAKVAARLSASARADREKDRERVQVRGV